MLPLLDRVQGWWEVPEFLRCCKYNLSVPMKFLHLQFGNCYGFLKMCIIMQIEYIKLESANYFYIIAWWKKERTVETYFYIVRKLACICVVHVNANVQIIYLHSKTRKPIVIGWLTPWSRVCDLQVVVNSVQFSNLYGIWRFIAISIFCYLFLSWVRWIQSYHHTIFHWDLFWHLAVYVQVYQVFFV
jgi:hypothetical protein